tara:strand:+ start:2266 stop:3033 length:768 start_codon:yes stop_codon:yes gene_type:complete
MAYMTDENGNYKRTVRCGYCYEKGHNKSACPKRKQDLKQNIERYTEELASSTASADDWQRKNAERYLRNAKDQLHKMETRGQNRKCGFCGEPGHTRRTCPERKRQTGEQLAKTIDVRRRAAERMMAAGFGPGALVKTHGESLAVVTEVDFENLTPSHAVSQDSYFYGAQLVKFQYLVPKEDSWGGRPTTHGSCYVPIDYLNIDDIPEQNWYRNPENRSCELLSGVELSEDTLLSENSIDKKKVAKWVISNIVDPK